MSIWFTAKCALILALRPPFLECEGGREQLNSVTVLYSYLLFCAIDDSLGETPKSLPKWENTEERIVPPLGLHSFR